MSVSEPTFATKLKWNLPWLAQYPFTRVGSFMEQTAFEKKHVIITIADHFEPGWSVGGVLDHKTQMERIRAYHRMARDTGEAVCDSEGTKFRHTNFYPAEQYHPEILEVLAEMQNEGLGEVEVHLHHGVGRPDTAENLRSELINFRDILAERHQCLSRSDVSEIPQYAFVHGNLALANSCGGRFCGVENEMEVLRDTGCYVDMSLPSAPDQSQVGIINQIYEYGGNVRHSVPHRFGKRVAANGKTPVLPLIFTGPLVFDWTRRKRGMPVPRIEDGALTAALGLEPARFRRWLSANVTVAGRPDWIFVKLYCHGFFDQDQSECIGEGAKRFFGELVNESERTGDRQIHFASAREAFNMVQAAIHGNGGGPGLYRDYILTPIMAEVKGRPVEELQV
jgi:hypothetical protein